MTELFDNYPKALRDFLNYEALGDWGMWERRITDALAAGMSADAIIENMREIELRTNLHYAPSV